MVFLAVMFTVTACIYTVPVTEEHTIAIDPAVLGVWEGIPTSDDPATSSSERMLVLPFSETEYLVECPVGPDALYYRAWPVTVAGRALVQLKWLGDSNGNLAVKTPYHLAMYSLAADGGVLEVRLLNDELISNKDATSSAALAEAIAARRDHPQLFDLDHVLRFRRPAKK